MVDCSFNVWRGLMRSHVLATAALFLCCSSVSFATEFSFHPSLAVSEEYTDNVLERSTDKKSDFITRVLPGISLLYKAPRWDWDGRYTFDYRYYAKRNRSDEITHDAAVKGQIRVVDEFFFVDLDEIYKKVSLDVTRDNTGESLFFNQSDRNTFTVSPYFVWRLNPKAKLKTGYRYMNTWYKEPTGVDRTDHSGFGELAYEITPRTTFTAGYTFTHQDSSLNDYDKHDGYVGGRYEFDERSYLFGQVGYTSIRYDFGQNVGNVFWNAGFSKTFDSLTAHVNTGVKYTEDPQSNLTKETFYSGGLDYLFGRGEASLFLNYSDFDRIGPGTIDTTRYTAGVRARYELVPSLTGSAGFEADNFVRSYMLNTPRRYFATASLSYLLSEGFTLTATYIYVDYYSPTVVGDNREINRAILELRKIF
ncbi:hypothetical protein GPICK_09095 [Geobacter pickeringii]|uniref:TIGR03016 family PEP-CTERM system-associated outer membrane protein n=2 Tax=Geobacter pickeringii TaxID=345632 RepID=A0A0B5B9T4_9BACT|nr:hypothetical protein GPICK_09095 [Geobacter pickeringii]